MTTIADQDLIGEFVVESLEHLADIENQFLAIEAAGADIDSELVNTVFRAIHSIKGAAGFLGLDTINVLSHSMENVLNLFRNKELIPTTENVDELLASADVLRGLLESTETSNDVDVTGHLECLKAIVEGDHSVSASEQGPADPAANPSASFQAAEAVTAVTTSETTPEPNTDKTPLELAEPASEAVSEPATPAINAPALKPLPPPSAPPPKQPVTSKSTTNGAAAKTKPTIDATIRVSVGLLDHLMNLAGELVLSRNRLLQTVSSGDQTRTEAVVNGLDQVTNELQEAIMRTRMQPIGSVFGKFRRVVRDLSQKLGKECRLLVDGEEVEVDKSIIEAIGDPLTHLVRNSVDHGIEMGADRVQQGKLSEGTISLRAFHAAGKVHISISDDGRGIDADKLRASAVTRGLITQDQAREMSDHEAVRLIFHPGFSLAEKVSEVSGRGVGMDVVRSNIEKLSGTVDVETKVGEGTRIDVRLPLTLAIVPSLIVRCRDQRFAVPQGNIKELVRIRTGKAEERIERVKSAEMFRLRGVLLPLVRLSTALNLDEENESTIEDPRAQYIIVVESASQQYGLVVDGVEDSEEIVVKPLGRHVQQCRTLAGATILGDGTVAPILDVTGIASHVALRLPNGDASDSSRSGDGEARCAETQTALVVTNHPDEKFAIPMQLIARLERISSQQIDHVGGQEILQYRGGTLPLVRIENVIAAAPPPEMEKLHVVVFKVVKREVGLVVPSLVDIQTISTDVDTSTFREPGVLGSVVVNDTATRLLDLYEITQAAHPDWFDEAETPVVEAVDGSAPRLLVVEDSEFFLTQLTRLLESVGYEVVGSCDGQEAWETLEQPGTPFDLVVTDIEMPRMDGLALSRKIKNDPRFQHLPIIAVSSLASEDDVLRGKEAGVDAYHVKLERDELLETVGRLLATVNV